MRKHLTVAVFLATTLAAAPAAAAGPGTDPALDTDLLDAKLAEFAAAGDYSVVAEVRDGDQTWSAASGPRGFDDATPAEPDDRVRIASLTKSMVAVILFQLEAEGAVDLDGTIGDHLPGLLPYEDEPTIRQVLQHTGGLRDYFLYLYPSLADNDLTDLEANHRTHYEPEAIVEIGTQDPQWWAPGEGWTYSNTGYFALGLLIEELTGNSLGHELEQRVFEPVGMDDSYLPHHNSSGFRGDHLVPYVTTGDEEEPFFDSTGLSHTHMWAAGGVIADTEDVNDFYRAVADGTLLSAEQLAEATSYVDTGLGFGYGLGFVGFPIGCPDDPDAIHLGHTGGGLGHTTYSFHSLDGQQQITFTWNLDDRHEHSDPDEFGQAFAALLVAGLCGLDIDEGARTMSVPDLSALQNLRLLG